MPEPVPTPTAAQILDLSLIIRESYDDTATAINADSVQAVSNAKWAKALTSITAWNLQYALGKQQKKKVGPIEWYAGTVSTPLDFVNSLRLMYGFEALTTLSTQLLEISSLEWFG